MQPASHRAYTPRPPALQRDQDLHDCAMLEGLTWSDLLATAGVDALAKVQDSGAAIEDRAERRRYYANVAFRAGARFALLHGQRPRGWNKPAVCRHCGPVWVMGDAEPGARWDRLDQCPCCKVKPPPQGFARPHVRCADCKFFRATIDPVTGKAYPWGFCEALNKSVSASRSMYCPGWCPRDA